MDPNTRKKEPPRFAWRTEPEDNGCIIGVIGESFCKIGCFTLGTTAINSLSWGHTFSGRTWCMASKNGSKNNDTPRVIIVYNTINNGTKYPGGYFEPAIMWIPRTSSGAKWGRSTSGDSLLVEFTACHPCQRSLHMGVVKQRGDNQRSSKKDGSSTTLKAKQRDPDRLLLGSFQVSIVPIIKS